ncbi:MAG: DNA-3-methyladenine glycosylase 2 family protein [Oscillospiraceae bacterium]|nr:DNA-3-methyladenine glycosylase 2 family protein [Oscillospiraceae bacterium]
MNITQKGNIATLSDLHGFSADRTFDCGQCFRFDKAGEGWQGVAFGKFATFTQPSPDKLIISPCTTNEALDWVNFLGLNKDYSIKQAEILSAAMAHGAGEVMSAAMEAGDGIRILRQEPWEALCSFIISQNNNISRIKKNIAALSASIGVKTACGSGYAFPTPRAICTAGEEELRRLGLGFRAKYVLHAAEMVAFGELDLDAVKNAGFEQGREMLMAIKGVGPKVAACALLFGFDKGEAFPEDVWIKRSLLRLPAGFTPGIFGENAGLAQQYLFYLERYEKGK